eukprot:GHVS01021861.1.p1 GENE.GHVS01021861.1~~GHVS01021861.1.p1  ORF type:complete len:196 (+),score=40.06 GHVS01021861.1:210-797(+)
MSPRLLLFCTNRRPLLLPPSSSSRHSSPPPSFSVALHSAYFSSSSNYPFSFVHPPLAVPSHLSPLSSSSSCRSSCRSFASSDLNPVRLKVKGVRHGMSIADLRSFFQDFSISSITKPIDIVKDRCERLTGYAHVYFDDEDEARRAQKALNRRYLHRSLMELSLDYDSLSYFYRKQYFIEKLKRYDYPDIDNYSKT